MQVKSNLRKITRKLGQTENEVAGWTCTKQVDVVVMLGQSEEAAAVWTCTKEAAVVVMP